MSEADSAHGVRAAIPGETQAELHNRLVGPIIASIVRPVLEAGGSPQQVMVLLESVVTGVLLTIVRLGGDMPTVELLMDGVNERLAKTRLGDIEPAGNG